MAMLAVTWSAIGVLAAVSFGFFALMRSEMGAMRSELKGEMREMRTELTGRMDRLDGRMDVMHSELTGRIDALQLEVSYVRHDIGVLDGKVEGLSVRVAALERTPA
jgi:tetrahydromethanopterin S-methyltransferase subunit G